MSDEQRWTETRLMRPREGVLVDTISETGIQQPLKRSGSLWFFPDGGMYVYYTPKFWREAAVLSSKGASE